MVSQREDDDDVQNLTIGNCKIISELGDGQYGTAYLARSIPEETELVCVKVFKDQAKGTHSFSKEVQAGQAGLAHPNVCALIEFGKGPMKDDGVPVSEPKIFIVSEVCPNGEAFDYVSASAGLEASLARQAFG
jgi:serine/threonine protein kinase